MAENKKLLLTGAGFTANFGAPVASLLWNDLFNYREIQKNNRLVTTLKNYRNESDFEGFFHDVVYTNDYTEDERNVVVKAILDIFRPL